MIQTCTDKTTTHASSTRAIYAPNPLPAMLVAVGIIAAMAGLYSLSDLFWVKGLACSFSFSVFCIWRWPRPTMAMLVKGFVFSSYRIRRKSQASVLGFVPATGAAVIVCNHVSFIDAMIISAVTPRPIRFVADHMIAKMPVLGRVFYHLGAIPIAPYRVDAATFNRAFEAISQALQDGEVVCIFPEGQVTYDGKLAQFKRGIERIIERDPVPIVPIALSGLWGSFFSRKYGRAMTRPFALGWRAKIDVIHGHIIDATEYINDTKQAASLQAAISQLLTS